MTLCKYTAKATIAAAHTAIMKTGTMYFRLNSISQYYIHDNMKQERNKKKEFETLRMMG